MTGTTFSRRAWRALAGVLAVAVVLSAVLVLGPTGGDGEVAAPRPERPEASGVEAPTEAPTAELSTNGEATVAGESQTLTEALGYATNVLYVRPTGDDNNTGRTENNAFRTIGKALTVVSPGETVYVMNGTYREALRSDSAIVMRRSGTANAYIRIAAYPGHQPRLESYNRNGFRFERVSYVEFSGFELSGGGSQRDYEGIGIHVSPNTHHVRIRNNTVRNFPAGGIGVSLGNHVTITGNVVSGNARWHPNQHSGISIFRSHNIGGGNDSNGYSNYISGNVVYDNRNDVVAPDSKKITDGNCVILDGLKVNGYTGRTLISNNVCHRNGGRGVHIYDSLKVDVINNTVHSNLQTPSLERGTGGELSSWNSNDVRFENNLVYPAAGKRGYKSERSSNVTFSNNVFALSSNANVPDGNTVLTNRNNLFGSIPNQPTSFTFAPAADNRIVDAGSSNWLGTVGSDINAQSRPQGGGVDVGAIETSNGVSAPPPAPTTTTTTTAPTPPPPPPARTPATTTTVSPAPAPTPPPPAPAPTTTTTVAPSSPTPPPPAPTTTAEAPAAPVLPALGGGGDRAESPDIPDRTGAPLPDGTKPGETVAPSPSAPIAPGSPAPAAPAPSPGLARQVDAPDLGVIAGLFNRDQVLNRLQTDGDDRTPAQRSADAALERLVVADDVRTGDGTVDGVAVRGLVDADGNPIVVPAVAEGTAGTGPAVNRSIDAGSNLTTKELIYRNTALAAAAMLALSGLLFLWKATKP